MTKEFYRSYFLQVKPFIKLSVCCRSVGISKTTFSTWLNDSHFDNMISLEKLDSLFVFVQELCKNALDI